MVNLYIGFSAPVYEDWKKMFDSDPIGRQKMGVRTYQILRANDNPNDVVVNMQFDTAQQAEALQAALREVFKEMVGKIITNPQTRIAEIVETVAVTA